MFIATALHKISLASFLFIIQVAKTNDRFTKIAKALSTHFSNDGRRRAKVDDIMARIQVS